MNLIRVAVAVGLAWMVAKLILQSRRGAPVDADDGLARLPSVDTGLPVRVRAMTVPSGAAGRDIGGAGFASNA